jgi:hypothetical protein
MINSHETGGVRFCAVTKVGFGNPTGRVLARRPGGWRCHRSQGIAHARQEAVERSEVTVMHAGIISQTRWQKLACKKVATYTPRPIFGDLR